MRKQVANLPVLILDTRTHLENTEVDGRIILKGNSNKSLTKCNNIPVYYPEVYLYFNMFRAFSRPSSGAQ
jgi:hypothetical protein